MKPIPRKFPEWLDPKLLVLGVLVVLFMVAMAWSEPGPQAHKLSALAGADIPLAQTQVIEGTPPANTPTAIPLEWQTNREMANGVVFGAVVLVLIIVGGTLAAIRRK